MSSSAEIRALSLAQAQTEVASEVLGRAFWDDPMSMYLLPDEGHRTKALPAMLGTGVRLGFGNGEVWTTPGSVEGAAVWIAPGRQEFSDEQVAAAGGEQMAEALGPDAMERFGKLMAAMGEQHAANMGDTPHWYLLILGVDPPRQGQGVGGDLLRPMLERLDELGLPAYLETMKTRNLPFYERHGFKVVSEADVDGTLHFWCMRRDPRRTG